MFNCITISCKIYTACNRLYYGVCQHFYAIQLPSATTQLVTFHSYNQRIHVANSYIVQSVWLV